MQEGAAGDFLRRRAETPLHASYSMAGISTWVETNSESILQNTREHFGQARTAPNGREEIRLRLWVEDVPRPETLRSKVYYRGLGNQVFVGLGAHSSLLINLHALSVLGRLTPAIASDTALWKKILLPSLLTIVGPSVGLVPLHCACVAWKGSGVLLAGDSGSGKSTLSLSLGQMGFDFLSDDRTLVSSPQGRLIAWSLFTETKLCADALAHFQNLKELPAPEIWKGRPVVRLDPIEALGLSHIQCCEPRWLIFLEQEPNPSFSLSRISREESEWLLRKDLHQEESGVLARLRPTIDQIANIDCYKLRYGGNPHTVAGALRCLVTEGLKPGEPARPPRRHAPVLVEPAPADPLRRFRPTPLHSDVLLMGRGIRIETNSPLVLKHVNQVLDSADSVASKVPQFLWRIACEPGEEAMARWPEMSGFSSDDVRYVNLGQRSFIAVDLTAREAVGILPQNLAEDGAGFSSVFLATMAYLTAPALGLTPISAACVAERGKGVLLIGPPGSGKTTSSYFASKLGLEFHSDQGTFLEPDGQTLKAWGDFWPAAFRPETAEFSPELLGLAHPFHYWDRTFLCMEKSPPGSPRPRDVTPVACLFLDREAGTSPRLIPLPNHGRGAHFVPQEPFLDDVGPTSQREAVHNALRQLPSYRLLYGDDPCRAAFFIRSVLSAHRFLEARL